MIDPGYEGYFRWFEGVISGEVDVKEENTSRIR
jgi:hypothetical protein